MPPPSYHWSVSLAPGTFFTVEAAYPVCDDGYMLLKDSDHKIVFTAQPGTGCTFTRGALVTPGASPALGLLPAASFPAGCKCAYTTTVTFGAGAPVAVWERNVSWGCQADHAEIDRHAVVTADSDRSAQAEDDAAYARHGTASAPEVREMRYGLTERAGPIPVSSLLADAGTPDGDGVRL